MYNFEKCPILGLFYFYFRIFWKTYQFWQEINVKNIYQVYGAGKRTHDLQDMSLIT